MVTIKLTVIAVEATHDGVVVVLAQEKMRVPIAEPDVNSDEMRFAKKMSASMRLMGIQMGNPQHDPNCPNNPSWKTGFWVTNEDYEAMGRPTVGDMLAFTIEKSEAPVAIMTASNPAPKRGRKVAKP